MFELKLILLILSLNNFKILSLFINSFLQKQFLLK